MNDNITLGIGVESTEEQRQVWGMAPWFPCIRIALIAQGDNIPAHFSGYISSPQRDGDMAEWLTQSLPWLPVETLQHLQDPVLRDNFLERVYALHELQQLWQRGLTRGGLIAFHSRYKLLLLAHSQPLYRELGPFVAAVDRWDSLEAFVVEYRLRLLQLLAQPATRANHTNVLMHIQGYFRPHLSAPQRQALAQLIDSYRQGQQPLLAPVTLLKQSIWHAIRIPIWRNNATLCRTRRYWSDIMMSSSQEKGG